MAKVFVEGEEGEELQRLIPEYVAALQRVGRILAEKGMQSPEFAEADAETGRLWRRMREIID